jgi:hypothetical protein
MFSGIIIECKVYWRYNHGHIHTGSCKIRTWNYWDSSCRRCAITTTLHTYVVRRRGKRGINMQTPQRSRITNKMYSKKGSLITVLC